MPEKFEISKKTNKSSVVISDCLISDLRDILGLEVSETEDKTGICKRTRSLIQETTRKLGIEKAKGIQGINFDKLRLLKPENELATDNLYIFDKPGSTQDVAEVLSKGGEREFTTVIGLEQSRGRGYRERKWSSIKGNLHFTTIWNIIENLPNETEHEETVKSNTNLMSVIIVVKILADSIKNLLGESVFGKNNLMIKPLNDLVFEKSKKLAGILLEGNRIGMGVNFVPVPYESMEKTEVIKSASFFQEVIVKCGLNEKVTPMQLLNQFILNLKSFTNDFLNSEDSWSRASKLLKVWSEYQEYFVKYIRGDIVQIFDRDHSNPAEGIFMGLDRKMNDPNWLQAILGNRGSHDSEAFKIPLWAIDLAPTYTV